jgi:hypothetical protein
LYFHFNIDESSEMRASLEQETGRLIGNARIISDGVSLEMEAALSSDLAGVRSGVNQDVPEM